MQVFFHRLAVLLPAISVAWSPFGAVAADNRPACKSTPGTASWPSVDSWNRLNVSTGGRLLRPTPPGAVCHPGQPTYNATKCPDVQSGWKVYEFHQADPVSSMWNQFNNDTCLPNASYPCSGQGYPFFVINATMARHVKLGVDFGKSGPLGPPSLTNRRPSEGAQRQAHREEHRP